MSPLILRPLELSDEFAAKMAHFELAIDDFEFLFDWEPEISWADYVQMMQDYSAGIGLPADRVRADFLVAVDESGEIVGRLSIRYEFNDFLREYGGHVGYAVRPQFRRRGYAVEMLKAGVSKLNAAGVDPVLVTCLEENLASAAVITKAGGEFDSLRDIKGRTMRRFWIKSS